MKWYDFSYQKDGEYSIMVFTEKEDEPSHSHLSGTQMAGVNANGERVPMLDADGTFPKTLFDEKGSYPDCCVWFAETESYLRGQGHSVHTYTEATGNPCPNKRMLVNFSDEDVAYMEANDMIFLTEENSEENTAGRKWKL